MPVERAHEHPTFEMGEVRITSFAAPARGSEETALFRADIPPGAGLPPHRHDHFDVFAVTEGTCTFHLGDETFTLAVGDGAVVPSGALHWLEAGPDGVTIVVTMLAETTPPWVS
jgi:quercetin dioxygenase-like cupin family protein